jgi:putative MFS transporter
MADAFDLPRAHRFERLEVRGDRPARRKIATRRRQMRAAAPLILFGALITLANNIMSFSFHAYQAELYPTRIRALGVGFVYSFSRLSTVFSAFVIAFFLDRFGVSGVFALIAASMMVVALAIGVFGPRTRNLSLEAISR